MKKLLGVICAGLLLAGCSGGGDPVKKTCTMDMNGLMDAEMVLEGKGDVLEKVAINMSMPYESIGIKKDASDEQKETLKKQLEESLAEQYADDVSGVDITSDFDDKGLNVTISAEASMMEKAVNASSIEEAVKDLEGEGFTCK